MSAGYEIGAVPTPTRDVYSVSRLNREVRVLLERGLGVLWVEGELSNFSQPPSGHWYFSLKDRDAQLRCAMYRAKNSLVGFTPRAGMQLLVRGRISLYEPKGEFQLLVEHLEEAGVGALRREFERLKIRLAAEGLFAQERKRALPRFPRRIGIITSPTGAAIRDILKTLARRYPPAAVLIYPSAVQGAAAVPTLVAALTTASRRAECDVLILARGGGSLEDLWAFNDERVARAIHGCALPLVSGVGHEIDFTIADFVADVRAPTPSAAAEMVVPDRHACLEALGRTAQRMQTGMRRELRTLHARLESVSRRLGREHPGVRLQQQLQRLDEFSQRLAGSTRGTLHREGQRLAELRARLQQHSPRHALGAWAARNQSLQLRLARAMGEHSSRTGAGVEELRARLERAGRERINRSAQRLALAQRALDAVSPLATVARGFAIVKRADGTVLTDAAAVGIGEEIEARLTRGSVTARVTGRK
ncbi:MAG: exodeoxyribonuclease VII large subunit [Gammaproteobacteria bacterium]|nr:exodeoxyribonuclease VII large subunit [Gammaproteobacteria bacterium]MBV9727715.1 exodeoxyribonuclease VII large subunit [Gammaproteobacteria bacterium]